jgi:oxygen-independent coproporphyrinogen-3 oxidase
MTIHRTPYGAKNLAQYKDSIALYIHIPFCTAKCRYCGFYSEPIKNHDTDSVIKAMSKELGRYALGDMVRTVYIGGGSPSCLPKEQLLRLIGEITKQCSMVEEFTIEVNPGQVDKISLRQLRQAGINRLSIGGQSFNQNELKFLGRTHTAEDIGRAVQMAKWAGFENINIDLIFAIPHSTVQSWGHSLQSAIDLGVQHISAYSLTYEKGTPLQKAVVDGTVIAIDEQTDCAMYETAIEKLEAGGFEQYEISNFARVGFECRHNLAYWANRPYIGIGPGASSYWQGTRCKNIADIKKYVTAVERGKSPVKESERPNALEAACETAVLNLRRRAGIDFEEFSKHSGFDAAELFAEAIEKYKAMGLLKIKDGRVFLAQKALPIADSVLCDFSAV